MFSTPDFFFLSRFGPARQTNQSCLSPCNHPSRINHQREQREKGRRFDFALCGSKSVPASLRRTDCTPSGTRRLSRLPPRATGVFTGRAASLIRFFWNPSVSKHERSGPVFLFLRAREAYQGNPVRHIGPRLYRASLSRSPRSRFRGVPRSHAHWHFLRRTPTRSVGTPSPRSTRHRSMTRVARGWAVRPFRVVVHARSSCRPVLPCCRHVRSFVLHPPPPLLPLCF